MKPKTSFAEQAATTLARAGVGAEEMDAATDDRIVLAMKAALRTRARRRMQRRVAIGLGVVALAAGVVLAVSRSSPHADVVATPVASAPTRVPSAVARAIRGDVLRVTKAGSTSLAVGGEVDIGDRIVALQDAALELGLPTGTRLSLEGGGDVTLLGDAPTQVLGLAAGSMRAEVVKLQAGERFIVRTSDAEVEVRGTTFRIGFAIPDPNCGHGTTTRVNVDEGVVTVRASGHEWTVSAPDSWPECTPAAPPSGTPSALAVSPPKPRRTSDLAAQNDLFDQAMAAKRRGDRAVAIGLFDRLLTTYPASPLAEQAFSERAKLIAAADAGH
jgi:ferric-dicitrate binding protein FerR (iron transport regulator)